MLPKEMLWLIRADLITVHYKEHISSSLGSASCCTVWISRNPSRAQSTALPCAQRLLRPLLPQISHPRRILQLCVS